MLTRSFSSDATEGMFSHARLKGGSNDATNERSAEYALRQILRCGIIKASSSANTVTNTDSISRAQMTLTHTEHYIISEVDHGVDVTMRAATQLTPLTPENLPLDLNDKLENLSASAEPSENIYSASVAFLAGYVIKKINDKWACDVCLTPLLSKTTPGPLLKLILLQDRGGLTYPNDDDRI